MAEKALALMKGMYRVADWQPIETAPKDGQCVFLLSRGDTLPDGEGGEFKRPPKCAVGHWDAGGTSWVDEFGSMDSDEVCQLAKTGVWFSGGGWFQPNEVTHWMPLPKPPQ